VLEQYKEGDTVEGKVTKVVTFGAFVEILPGVEGLVHISELAQHHVENPREVVSQGQQVRVQILEIDGERRRLSLSMKRVEGDQPEGAAPNLDLSEDVFSETAASETAATVASGPETYEEGEPAADDTAAESPADEPADEPAAEEPADS
jgi:small subunit ribosomal protein S1